MFDYVDEVKQGQMKIYPPRTKRSAVAIGEGEHHHNTIYMRYSSEYQILNEEQVYKQASIFCEEQLNNDLGYPLFFPMVPFLQENEIEDFNSIISLYENNTQYSRLKANLKLLSLLMSISEDEISKIISKRKGVLNRSIVQKMTSLINADYNKITGLQYIADTLNYNPTYLSAVFKRNIGTSPIEYLNRIRVEKAKKLIEDGKLTFQEISDEVGVKNYYYFSRIFKRFTNMTMSQYQSMIYK